MESDTLKVSIIVPTFNEALIIEESLTAIACLNPHEIIVVDGGSTDITISIARRIATHVVTSEAGRARQMNAGAKKATGDLLLFMHVDSSLPPESFEKMTEEMRHREPTGGAFGLHIESEKISLKLISTFAIWRSKYLNLVYGDQTIFVRAEIFQKLEGFSPLPICEDLEFFRRLSQQGKVILLKEKAHTSGRRWITEGILLTTLRNIIITTLFLLGFPPRILGRWYLVVR